MELTTSYPLWLALACLAMGIAMAWWLYNKSTARHGWGNGLSKVMAVLRAAAIAFLAFFLLQPMVKVLVEDVRKPVVVIAHDGSSSLLSGDDSASARAAHSARLEALSQALAGKFEVRAFTYGEDVTDGIDASQKQPLTNIDGLFREVYDRFRGPDLGAVILDGDGIWNRGSDPRSSAQQLGVPVFVLAMGDTAVKTDLVLKAVEHNRIAYLGNEFPLLAKVEARKLAGARTRVTVTHEGKVVASADVVVKGDPQFIELPLLVKATSAGLQRYTVAVASVEGETVAANNSRTVLIEVMDDRRKVLLLAAAPHPDIAALRHALTGLDGYTTELAYGDAFTGKVDDFDLVILHQLPSARGLAKNALESIRAQGVPAWYFIASGSDFNAMNALGAGVELNAQRGRVTDAQATVNKDFELFTLDPDQARAIERFPPLQVPFGEYQPGKAASVLLTQRVGVVQTATPLMVLQQGEQRTAVTCGEGVWRWRLADQQMNQSTAHFDGLVRKLVQFLAVKLDKQRFRTEHAQVFAENEPVVIRAELYNASFELVNTPEATITITDETGKDFPFTFGKTAGSYRLEAGQLPAGRYNYTARTTMASENYAASGGFTIEALVAEQLSTVADHGLWRDIAARSGGSVHAATDADVADIANALNAREDIAARSYAHTNFTDLISLKWLFFVLLALLAVEWGMRRWAGAY